MNRDRLIFPALRASAGLDWLQRPLNTVLAPFNPFDPRRRIDPYPLYERARSHAPVFHHRLLGIWIATGYDEVTQVLRGPVSVERRHTIEAITPYRDMKPENVDLMLSSLLMRDAPAHGRLRKLVNRAFTPRAVAELEPAVRQLTAQLIDELPASGATGSGPGRTVDVMAGLAERLPIYAIGQLLGIPRDRWEMLGALSEVVTRFVDPFDEFDPAVMDRAIDDLRALFERLAADRIAAHRDDLITALVLAEEDGQRLDRHELIAMLIVLLIAGSETTAGLIGNSIVALGRHPEAVALLRDRPDLAPNAVEELLRYDGPVQTTDRTVLEPFTVGDVTLPAGAVVMVLLGAANRDPRRFHEPDRLILDRPDPRPLSFGHGIHHCVGAALARLEATVVLPAFIEAFPDFAVDEADLRWRRSTIFRNPSALPVRLCSPTGPSASAAPNRARPGAAAG